MVVIPSQGEVAFEAAGATWKLLFGVNALCRFEQVIEDREERRRLLGGGDGQEPEFTTIRAAIWAGLQDHHPDTSFEDVGNIITHMGIGKAGALVAQAMLLAFPEVKKDAKPNPRKAARTKA